MPAAGRLIAENLGIWSSAVKTKSAAGRGKSNKLELYGIKKLRELILELAVRGLLVPQDPNDESANELLKKIEAKKSRLVEDGKLKKPKALLPIEDNEKPFELPEQWAWVRLAELLPEFQNGASSRGDKKGEDIVVVRLADIENFRVSLADPRVLTISSAAIEKYGLQKDDILIIRVNGSGEIVGRFVLCDKDLDAIYCDHFIRMRFRITVLQPSYLRLLGSSKLIRDRIEELFVSTAGQKTVNQKHIGSLLVSVPPVEEQYRIVAKVDELMTLCDQLEQQQESSITAHQTLVKNLLDTLTAASDREGFTAAWARIADHFDTLFTTEWSIDQLKQTVLQLAVMGKLVPQDPNDQPASELLKKIQAERAALLKDGKIKKRNALPAIEEHKQSRHLPEGWAWCRLDEMITLMDAGWSPACPAQPSPSDDVWGVLKTTAVQTLEYRQNENKVLAGGKEPRPQYEVKRGDILITRAGPKNRVAISCLVESTRPKLMISDKIIRFHLAEIGLSERYVALCLNSGATAAYLEAAKSGMAESQMNISQDKLKMAPIPLAPLNEQRKIIEIIDRLIKLCDTLKTQIRAARTAQLNLADAMAEQSVG